MRLIDAGALKKDIARLHILNDEAEIRKAYASNPYSTLSDFEDTLVSVFDAIDDAPTIDAVSVVRCKECKYRERCEQIVVFDFGENQLEGRKIDYCSYGERSDT